MVSAELVAKPRRAFPLFYIRKLLNEKWQYPILPVERRVVMAFLDLCEAPLMKALQGVLGPQLFEFPKSGSDC